MLKKSHLRQKTALIFACHLSYNHKHLVAGKILTTALGIRWFRKLVPFAAGAVLVCTLCLATLPAYAQNGSSAISQAFSTGGQDLSNGTLVSLEQQDQTAVEIAAPANVGRLVGVVSTQPLLAVSGNGSSQSQTQVVVSGTTSALVSDINGSIKAGDKITVSPISGVGMKATASGQIIGTAQSDFAAASAQTRTIQDTSGHSHVVHVGPLPVQVNVTYFTVPPPKSSILPSFLQNIADSIAGHDVSALRLFISGTVLLLGLVSIGVLMSSAVRSSIISIGRNPLSKSAVQKSLFTVGSTAFVILLLVLVAIYLILRL